MKEICEELRYQQSPEAVFELISSGSFQLELIAELGGQDGQVVEERPIPGGGLRLVTTQRTGVELPGFAKKIIPADTTVTQTYEWSQPGPDGSRRGTWSAEIKGAPIRMGGPTELRAEARGTLHLYLGEVKASVPMVGGRLESFALDNLRRDLARAGRFITGRLAPPPPPAGR